MSRLDMSKLHRYGGDDVNRLGRLGEAFEQDQFWADQSGQKIYAINTLGFRGPEFDPEQSTRLFVFGESHGFGQGLDWHECWASRFAAGWAEMHGRDFRNIGLSNFSEPGASNAYIARTLVTQCGQVKPDMVLLHFGDLDRAEGVVATHPIRIGTWFQHDFVRATVRDAPQELKELANGWRECGLGYMSYRSPADEAAESLGCILLAQFFCRANGIRAIATCDGLPELRAGARQAVLAPLSALIDPTFLVDSRIADVAVPDKAADDTHFGPDTHDTFANVMLRAVKQASEVKPPVENRSSTCKVRILVFGGDEDRIEVARQHAMRWVVEHGLSEQDCHISNHVEPMASNAQIARSVLTRCSNDRPDLVFVGFSDPWRHETIVDGQPKKLGRWLLTRGSRAGGVRGLLAKVGVRTSLQDRARRYYGYANEHCCMLKSLQSMLLVQSYCAASGIPLIASLGEAARSWSKKASEAPAIVELRQLIDQRVFVDRDAVAAAERAEPSSLTE